MSAIEHNVIKNNSNLKDSPLDYTDVTGQGTMALKPNEVTNLDDYNKIPSNYQNIVNTPFHPAPKSITDYGENGWLAYDSNHIYIGRDMSVYVPGAIKSKWHNPYTIKKCNNDINLCLKLYKEYLLKNTSLFNDIHELQGKVLGCWCVSENKCHGDILLELLEF